MPPYTTRVTWRSGAGTRLDRARLGAQPPSAVLCRRPRRADGNTVTKLLHDVIERFLVSFDTVWPPASGRVEVSSAPIVGVHPHDRLVETQPLQLLQCAPHQCLPDVFAPALRRDEEPIDLANMAVFVRAKAGRAPLDRVWPLRRLAGTLRSRPARCEFGRSRWLRRLPERIGADPAERSGPVGPLRVTSSLRRP
jgi:hypothetical protein